MIDVAISVLSPSSISYQILRTSSQGFQGDLFSGTVTGLTESISGFSYYVVGTDAGGAAENNLYFNNLQVVPEPAASILAALGAVACALRRRVDR